jgi:hypothetical protein
VASVSCSNDFHNDNFFGLAMTDWVELFGETKSRFKKATPTEVNARIPSGYILPTYMRTLYVVQRHECAGRHMVAAASGSRMRDNNDRSIGDNAIINSYHLS